MPAIRYQMPNNLADIARKNLAQADTAVSKFNAIADGASRLPYANTTTTTNQDVVAQPSAFKFSSIGSPVDTSLGVPPIDSFKQPTVSATSNPPDNPGWRFRSFGQSQLNRAANTAYAENPAAYKTNPDAYETNPAAYGRIASSPVIPADYKPRDMSKEQAKYGYGQAEEEE